jgi:multidrug efflux pump
LALAICVAVVVSSVMALTLVPMLCSKLLKKESQHPALARVTDRLLARCTLGYEKSLRATLARPWLSMIGLIVFIAALVPLSQGIKTEFVPQEDQDTVFAMAIAQEGTGMDTMRGIIKELQAPLLKQQEEDGTLQRILFVSPFFDSTAPTRAFARISLVPWNQRDYSAFELKDQIIGKWRGIPGIRVMAFMPAGLGKRGANNPVEFVLQGQSYEELAQWRDIVMEAAQGSGLFTMVNSDLKETQQQVHITIDVDRAAALGVSVRDVGESLQALMTEQEVSTYTDAGEEYPVIVQLEKGQRSSPDDISNIFVRSSGGELIQLSNLLRTENVAGIATLQRYNRMRSVTISGGLAAGVTLGQALDFLDRAVEEQLPAAAKTSYRGESLDYKESSSGIYLSLGLALLVLYLVMAAQFESFVHPTVIMLTVPLALAGGLAGLIITGETLNLFSQIGLLMIIGIASKNGILLVEFINQVRDEGVDFDRAILEACKLRLRPVMMTTISTLVGAVPLIVMTGPGSASRNVLGIVVLSGVSLASLFTLYLVPGFYHLIARRTGSPETVAREMRTLEEEYQPTSMTSGD